MRFSSYFLIFIT